ncbi:MAG: hypothetical protein IJH07_05465 [Ruminococcus sp.]|nr:hypothetical protein [Ruminococcus sp.]
MRCMKRNQKLFYYAPYLRRETPDKGYGYSAVYGDAVAMRGNISPATGSANAEQFGNNIEYDRVIVLDDPDCPIDENAILFIDVEPTKNDDGNYVNDYIVKKVARSLNSVSIAISRVVVS